MVGTFESHAHQADTYRSDAERGKRYVETFGGKHKVVAAAVNAFNKGDYGFTVDLLNNIVGYQ